MNRAFVLSACVLSACAMVRGQEVEYECAVPAGNRQLKVLWNGPAELDRVEIYYDGRQ